MATTKTDRLAAAIENLMDLLLDSDPDAARRLARSYCGCESAETETQQDDPHGMADWRVPEEHPGDWYEILVVLPGVQKLTSDEIGRVSGCLGYSLREHIRGESLGAAVVSYELEAAYITYGYDSTKSRSDDIGDHISDAFDDAHKYIVEGTPIRKTDRGGPGTRGTRLVEGVARLKGIPIAFFVR